MGKKLDLIGKIFGRLLVLNIVPAPLHIKNKNCSYWLCQCICNKQVIVRGNQLVNGNSTSCGCYNREQNIIAISYDNIQDVKKASAKYIYKEEYNNGDLTFEQFYELSQQNCYYCNIEANLSRTHRNIFLNIKKIGRSASNFSVENGNFIYNGLDKINSSYSHNINNVVPCCITCNSFKHMSSFKSFLSNIDNLLFFPNLVNADRLSYISDIIKDNNLKLLRQIFPLKTNNKSYDFMNTRKSIISGAKSRNIIINLTDIQIMELTFASCAYCGKKTNPQIGKYNGIDRVNNFLGYTIDNSVSCCKYCNFAKNNLSLNDFLIWVKRIKSYYPILLNKIEKDERFI